MSVSSMTRRAEPSERLAALRLAVTPANMPALERDRQTAAFIRYAERQHWSIDQLWVVGSGRRLHWSGLAIPSAGRTAMLLTASPPRIDAATMAPVLDEMAQTQFALDIQLVQLLLCETDEITQSAAASAEFETIANLRYMRCDLNSLPTSADLTSLTETYQWQPYSPAVHHLFRQAISESYEESLDCRALAGRRDIEDVIAGHKAAGEFDGRHWWLVRDAQDLLGCVLLARLPQRATMELVYIGVTPRHRGLGVGRALLTKAVKTAISARCDTLTLAVDCANEPALNLYQNHGFEHCDNRIAYARFKN